jgi:hypothetical protein
MPQEPVTGNSEKQESDKPQPKRAVKQPWSKPEITSYKPASLAEGVFINPGDGISNAS